MLTFRHSQTPHRLKRDGHPMRTLTRAVVVAFVIVAFLIQGSPAGAANPYPCGDWVQVVLPQTYALNTAGTVGGAGNRDRAVSIEASGAYTWWGGIEKGLPSRVRDISDNGIVAGEGVVGHADGPRRPWREFPGQPKEIAHVDALGSTAVPADINGSGAVIGTWNTLGIISPMEVQAFVWQPGVDEITFLPMPSGHDMTWGIAINEAGWTTGFARRATEEWPGTGVYGVDAIRWAPNGDIEVISSPGAPFAYGIGIDEENTVIGKFDSANGYAHAFRWDPDGTGFFEDLGSPGDHNMDVTAVNDQGLFAGYYAKILPNGDTFDMPYFYEPGVGYHEIYYEPVPGAVSMWFDVFAVNENNQVLIRRSHLDPDDGLVVTNTIWSPC